jgi:uncharacterized protein YlzI (FlbEa/FlbD family)
MTVKFTKNTGGSFYVNPEYIVAIEPTPFGTRLVLTAGPEVMLKDTEDDVVAKLYGAGVDAKNLTRTNNYERI